MHENMGPIHSCVLCSDNEISGEEREESESVIITKCYSKITSSTGMRTINK